MKQIIVFLFLALFTWIGIGSYIYTCKIQCLCNIISPSQLIVSTNNTTDTIKKTLVDSPVVDITNLMDSTSLTTTTKKVEEILRRTYTIHFVSNSSEMLLKEEHKVFFKEAKKLLVREPNSKIELIGHTDNTSTESNNLIFGKQRANNVKKHLIENGYFTDHQFITISKGEETPISSNETVEGRAQNRRVEIHIKK